jgi:endoribonuclease Dicer
MAYMLPAIIHRIESNFIALDGCALANLTIEPALALEAFTRDTDSSEDGDLENTISQHGMETNYERLEFLGDSFLKMATTIAIYTQLPEGNEFEYHVERMMLINNKNLFNTAVKLGLPEYIRSKQFNRRTWYPEGLKMTRGKDKWPPAKHNLAKKTIADVCEALIGAAYLSSLENNFDMAVQAVTTFVSDEKHKFKTFAEYYQQYTIPRWQNTAPSPIYENVAVLIEEKTGYKFKSPALLRCAFKHPSCPRHIESLPNYQRLEFLGDALLDMVCVDFLFKHFPGTDPQWLTEHKMAMVSNQFLGFLCVDMELHKHILLYSTPLQSQIVTYVADVRNAREAAEEEAESTGSPIRMDYWLQVKDPPKCLPDILEAYVGAVFVDSCFDYFNVQIFFDKFIRKYFNDIFLYDSFAGHHPINGLNESMQTKFQCTDWRLLVSEVSPTAENAGLECLTSPLVCCGLLIHGAVAHHAVATSGRQAKALAAKNALETLELMTAGDFKDKFKCDCTFIEQVQSSEKTTE